MQPLLRTNGMGFYNSTSPPPNPAGLVHELACSVKEQLVGPHPQSLWCSRFGLVFLTSSQVTRMLWKDHIWGSLPPSKVFIVWIFLQLKYFFNFSLSQSAFLGQLPLASPGENGDSEAHSRWGFLNFMSPPSSPWDYAPWSLRTTAFPPLSARLWNNSPLITKMTQAWKGHQIPTWEVRNSEFPVVKHLHCIILWARGQGHRYHFQNTCLRN